MRCAWNPDRAGSNAAQKVARDAKNEFAFLFGNIEGLRLLPLAPLPAFPPAEEADDRCGSYFSRKEQVTLEREEHGRAFGVLREGENCRADFAMGAKRETNS